MALVTLQRSPTPSAASTASTTNTNAGEDFGSDDERRLNQSLSESFFMVKGAALFLQQGNSPQGQKAHPHHKHAGDLPQHLQVMINILRSEDRIKLAVRLESAWSDRVRYMVVVYTSGRQDTEENILLGMDFSNKDSCSIGMVLPLWSDTKIHLDGDGGFSVNTVSRNHVFKPVSVQAMWSALQILHKACEVSRRYNYFPGGMALTWMGYYESCIASEQSCINEWNAMRDLETLRPDSPTMFVDRPTERERTECLIKAKLRSIMMYQDLENVTSKQIRTELELHMSCNLMQYKEFIDNEMLLILGQMDKATLIFDHLYLGSEWNASNLEELQDTGVGYILNVTREIDNFFPGTFSYHNVRVYDEEATDLLAHWNETYNFIVKAKKNQSKCLVHCKMGVSRSASTVIAYAMKEYGWSLEKAFSFVKQKRSITRPNSGFMRQLAEYEGILDASKQRHNKLWRPDRPDPDCDLNEDRANRTPELGTPPCCEEALEEKGAARPPSPCGMISLEVDPAYNNYYFRRLSDSALDSDPSTPVRAPPLLNMERVFIEIEDVERDALLDDEAYEGREGLSLPHFGLAGEGTAAQTCCRGPEPLEELRLRLEFSTVEEEDEEEAQKEEAEMEALAQPGGRVENAQGVVKMVLEDEGEKEDQVLDLVALNQNSNNNNHFDNLSSLSDTAVSTPLYPIKPSAVPQSEDKSSHRVDSLVQDAHLCLNLAPLPPVPSVTFPCSPSPLGPCGPLCDCAKCASSALTPLADAPCSLTSDDTASVLEGEAAEGKPFGVPVLPPVPELLSPGEKRPGAACNLTPQLETLVELQRSGLVRRRAERLERLSGLSQEGPQPVELLNPPDSGAREGHSPGEVSTFPGDFHAGCSVSLEPLTVPLTNDALLGAVASGGLTPTSSPHGSTLTRSSSSDSIRSVRGKPGLVRQRAQEIEARMRLAGLTVPSRLKRSNSLAKLGSLNFSSEDLCSVCSSDTGTLLLLSLSPEPGLEWECPASFSSSSNFVLSQPRTHRDQATPERALSGGPWS
ncbi:protein phosphatase Slingshot homolog 1 isoform X2 [Esox lucius]|uniref:Protein phosphatase Slingshot homolog 1 n=1 Tax=Esox lucius TaxID=8010 RepID=A0AAY5KND9_ESOLU|nr:protein phosphatase Slingshot homolog 1 isoform X2 [Esox lucius]